jgi:hypothetical protein
MAFSVRDDGAICSHLLTASHARERRIGVCRATAPMWPTNTQITLYGARRDG